jgi:hypothetical protein
MTSRPEVPNRILYERICVSESIALLSAEEERFFYRLLVQCDDFGRFDGRASVLRARCFALQLDGVTDDDVFRWLHRLIEAGLVVMYAVDGHAFLRVANWDKYQYTRAKRSKYPEPNGGVQASASIRKQIPADAPENPDPVSGIRESLNENRETSTPPTPPVNGGAHTARKRKRASNGLMVPGACGGCGAADHESKNCPTYGGVFRRVNTATTEGV